MNRSSECLPRSTRRWSRTLSRGPCRDTRISAACSKAASTCNWRKWKDRQARRRKASNWRRPKFTLWWLPSQHRVPNRKLAKIEKRCFRYWRTSTDHNNKLRASRLVQASPVTMKGHLTNFASACIKRQLTWMALSSTKRMMPQHWIMTRCSSPSLNKKSQTMNNVLVLRRAAMWTRTTVTQAFQTIVNNHHRSRELSRRIPRLWRIFPFLKGETHVALLAPFAHCQFDLRCR